MLDLHNEPFQPTGSMDARTARRALGVSDMEFWDVFLRETVQNSWDAHGASSSIGFKVDARRLTRGQTDVLRNDVFKEVPPSLKAFAASLGSIAPAVLVVADSGTRGLSGPLRADQVPPDGERNDFCDFVRNVGRDESKQLDGGTYGFGKSVLYNASSVKTCIIYSKTWVQGTLEARLIVSRVDQQYTEAGRRFTGRHWWGRFAEDGVLDPLLNQEAVALAHSLGLDLLGDVSGTVLAVISPVMSALDDSEDLLPLVEHIRNAALRWAWPHMVDGEDGPAIRFEFSAEGQAISLPGLEAHPVLRHYASAYRRAVESIEGQVAEIAWPTSTFPIATVRSPRYLGQLAFTKWLTNESHPGWDTQHHVALMRRPHLVVKYLEIDSDPLNQQIAGVFIAADGVNDEFALSEPAAHDDWKPAVTPASEGRRPASPVRYALNRIADVFKENPPDPEASQGSDQSPGVTRVSRLLGDFLSGLTGGAEVRPMPRGGGRGAPAGPRVRIVGSPWLGIEGGRTVANFGFELTNIDSGALKAVPHIVLDRGIERPEDRPAGAAVPEVVGWYNGESLVARGDTWLVGDGVATSVRVLQPARSAVSMSIKLAASE